MPTWTEPRTAPPTFLPTIAGGVVILIALFSVERIVLRWAGVDVDKDLHEADEIPQVKDVVEM